MSRNVPQVWKAGHSGNSVSLPSPLMGGGEGYSVWVSVCLSVCVTYKLTEVTVDQMDPDMDGLIKLSVIRPPNLADISCEG